MNNEQDDDNPEIYDSVLKVPDRDKEPLITSALIKKVASLASSGGSILSIAKGSGVSRYLVRKILEMPECMREVEHIGFEYASVTRTKLKKDMANLHSEIMRVVKAKLKKDDLEAVKIALRVIGADQVSDESQNKDTTLNIIMPGQVTKETVVEVKGNKK